jgi:hypothetical protein
MVKATGVIVRTASWDSTLVTEFVTTQTKEAPLSDG